MTRNLTAKRILWTFLGLGLLAGAATVINLLMAFRAAVGM